MNIMTGYDHQIIWSENKFIVVKVLTYGFLIFKGEEQTISVTASLTELDKATYDYLFSP